jgi:outer membrane protein assembly factor BamB
LDPTNGAIIWESAIATPRGTNDMERLVDLIGPTDRVGDVVCARAFQAQVGCIDAQKGQSLWTRPSVGDKGLSGNANLVIAPLANGVVQAWRREDGERVWETERLKYRLLSAPLVTPKGVVIADSGGYVYVLSLGDGALLNRLRMDGEELAAAPAVASNVYVLVSREGRVTGLNLP